MKTAYPGISGFALLAVTIAAAVPARALTVQASPAQQAPPPVQPPPPDEQQPVLQASAGKPSWQRNLTVGGGAILWYYQPFVEDVVNDFSLFFANVVLDARLGRFGFHIEPRFRNGKLRPFFSGPAWVQEAYGDVTFKGEGKSLVIKAGKEYSHFGLFWDNSFYGNVQVYDGLKLDPDYGLSFEGVLGEDAAFGTRAWLQYFLIDGQTNVSLPGRDTISIEGAHRRNHFIGRVEPFTRFGQSATVKLGLSGAFLEAELPGLGRKNVLRGALDVTVNAGGLTLWGELIRQNGQSVTNFPGAPPESAPQFSKHNNYGLAGGEYTLGQFTGRYVFSLGDYTDLDLRETMHVPSLGVALDASLSLLAELVVWQRHTDADTAFVDRSLNVTLYGHF
jgi:hypothetical protein